MNIYIGALAFTAQTWPNVYGKADIVTGATANNLAGLDAQGNLTDSGIAIDDVVEDANYTHTDNNFTDTHASVVNTVLQPTIETLTTGSNSINLSTLAGQEYNPYNMSSGALTLVAASSPLRNGYAYGIIVADGATVPNVTAFTSLSGTYTNTTGIENHYLIHRKLNASGVATNYIQWIQPE